MPVGMNQNKSAPTRRGFHFAQFKALDTAQGTFSGYLAVFGNEDAGGDIIEPGAFTKTLAELTLRQKTRSSRFILPIFWSHNPDDPIGGFTCAREDAHGLYVEGELDLDIAQGQRAYSGMVKGYADGMSIGYFTIKSDFDRMGRRHLKELALFEGSITPIPMNADAVVSEVKSATGKASWPLGERDAAWDGGAAHKRIVAWATKDDGSVDVGKLQSVHFYSPDGDAQENVSEYKLLFCDLVDDKVTAMPKGIMACAGSHGVETTTGISADDKDAIKGKISAYYRRMASEFDDDSITAPWDDTSGKKGMDMTRREVKGSGGSITVAADGTHAAYTGTHSHDHSAFKAQGGDDMHAHEHSHDGDSVHEHTHDEGKAQDVTAQRTYRKARDFDTLFQSLSASDQLQDDWGDTFIAFVQCMSELMWQAHAQTNGYLMPEETTADIPEAAQANIDAFGKAVMALVTRSLAADFVPQIDWDGDQFIDPDGPNGEDADCKPGYYNRDLTQADTKAGRIMSAANHKAMGAMLSDMKKSMDALGATHTQLKAFHAKVDPNAAKPDSSDNGNDAPAGDSTSSGVGQPGGKSLTSFDTGAGTPPPQTQTQAGVTTPLTADDLSRSIRERMRAQRDASRLAQALATQAHA